MGLCDDEALTFTALCYLVQCCLPPQYFSASRKMLGARCELRAFSSMATARLPKLHRCVHGWGDAAPPSVMRRTDASGRGGCDQAEGGCGCGWARGINQSLVISAKSAALLAGGAPPPPPPPMFGRSTSGGGVDQFAPGPPMGAGGDQVPKNINNAARSSAAAPPVATLFQQYAITTDDLINPGFTATPRGPQSSASSSSSARRSVEHGASRSNLERRVSESLSRSASRVSTQLSPPQLHGGEEKTLPQQHCEERYSDLLLLLAQQAEALVPPCGFDEVLRAAAVEWFCCLYASLLCSDRLLQLLDVLVCLGVPGREVLPEEEEEVGFCGNVTEFVDEDTEQTLFARLRRDAASTETEAAEWRAALRLLQNQRQRRRASKRLGTSSRQEETPATGGTTGASASPASEDHRPTEDTEESVFPLFNRLSLTLEGPPPPGGDHFYPDPLGASSLSNGGGGRLSRISRISVTTNGGASLPDGSGRDVGPTPRVSTAASRGEERGFYRPCAKENDRCMALLHGFGCALLELNEGVLIDELKNEAARLGIPVALAAHRLLRDTDLLVPFRYKLAEPEKEDAAGVVDVDHDDPRRVEEPSASPRAATSGLVVDVPPPARASPRRAFSRGTNGTGTTTSAGHSSPETPGRGGGGGASPPRPGVPSREMSRGGAAERPRRFSGFLWHVYSTYVATNSAYPFRGLVQWSRQQAAFFCGSEAQWPVSRARQFVQLVKGGKLRKREVAFYRALFSLIQTPERTVSRETAIFLLQRPWENFFKDSGASLSDVVIGPGSSPLKEEADEGQHPLEKTGALKEEADEGRPPPSTDHHPSISSDEEDEELLVISLMGEDGAEHAVSAGAAGEQPSTPPTTCWIAPSAQHHGPVVPITRLWAFIFFLLDYSEQSTGEITLSSFVVALSALARGSWTDRLELVFRSLDVLHRGELSIAQISEILKPWIPELRDFEARNHPSGSRGGGTVLSEDGNSTMLRGELEKGAEEKSPSTVLGGTGDGRAVEMVSSASGSGAGRGAGRVEGGLGGVTTPSGATVPSSAVEGGAIAEGVVIGNAEGADISGTPFLTKSATSSSPSSSSTNSFAVTNKSSVGAKGSGSSVGAGDATVML